MKQYDRTLQDMRDWLADCFEDAPADLTDAEVLLAVQRHYDGGTAQFQRDDAHCPDCGRGPVPTQGLPDDGIRHANDCASHGIHVNA